METPIEYKPSPTGPNRRKRLAGIAGAGLIAGLMAVGIGGAALAQEEPLTVEPAAETTEADAVDGDSEGDVDVHGEIEMVLVEGGEDFELSDADSAVFDRFDQCLADNGLSEDTDEDALTEEALEAAFDTCDPILDELSPELQAELDEWEEHDFEDTDFEDIDMGEVLDISDADVAVLDRFDDCLVENGVDGTTEESVADSEIDAYMDKAFDTCDPILDELSPELQEAWGDDFIIFGEGDFEGCDDGLGEDPATEEDGS